MYLNIYGGAEKWNLFTKMCIYYYMCKLQSPSKYSPFDAIHLSRLFFIAQNCFWTHWFWYLLVLLLFFVLPLPHQQNIYIWGLCSRWDQVNRKGGAWESWHFWSKLLNSQHSVGRCRYKSPIMKWANVLKESSKKFTEA